MPFLYTKKEKLAVTTTDIPKPPQSNIPPDHKRCDNCDFIDKHRQSYMGIYCKRLDSEVGGRACKWWKIHAD
jgi:hypothetical protein